MFVLSGYWLTGGVGVSALHEPGPWGVSVSFQQPTCLFDLLVVVLLCCVSYLLFGGGGQGSNQWWGEGGGGGGSSLQL